MPTFILTFSSVGIRDGWIEITARDEDIARAWATREYGRWSDTVPSEQFSMADRLLFPLGCLGKVNLGYERAEHV